MPYIELFVQRMKSHRRKGDHNDDDHAHLERVRSQAEQAGQQYVPANSAPDDDNQKRRANRRVRNRKPDNQVDTDPRG